MVLKAFCIGLSFLFLGGCEEKKESPQEKILTVITCPDNPPFEFKDTAQGGDDVLGLDIDVIQKIGQKLGYAVKIIEADFAALIPSLQSGRADLAIAELAPTDERRQSVDFSDPYYHNASGLLVLADSAFQSEKDLEGQRVGVQLGTSNETLAQKWAETTPGLVVVPLNKVGDLVQELKVGRLQAALIGEAVARKITSQIPGFKTISVNASGGALAIAFPKGSSLVKPVNEAIKALTRDIELIAEKWIVH